GGLATAGTPSTLGGLRGRGPVTEVVVRPPSPRGSTRLIRLSALVAAVGLAAALAVALRPQRAHAPVAQVHVQAAHLASRRGMVTHSGSAATMLSDSISASAARAFDRGYFVGSGDDVLARA